MDFQFAAVARTGIDLADRQTAPEPPARRTVDIGRRAVTTLEVALEPNASKTMISELAKKFEQWTGRRWTIIVSNEQGQPTLRSVNQAAKQEHARTAEADPRVQEVLSRFPGAKVVEVRRLASETPETNINTDYGSDDPPDGSDADDDL